MILLPVNFDNACKVNAAADAKTIRVLFAAPFREAARHEESLYEPLCEYIDNNYRLLHTPKADGPRYELWVRR